MVNRKTNVANFWETTLTAPMGTTDLSATVASTSGLTSPALLVIDPDVPASREVVYFDGSYTGTSLASTSLSNRYLSGSAAGSGLSHSAGAVVRSVPLRQHIDDLNDRVGSHTHTGAGDAGAAVSHDNLTGVSADDHHAQSHAHNGADGSGTVDHGNLAGLGDDDHTIYVKADGTRAMTGGLDMGGQAITNVGNVDGVDVSALDAQVQAMTDRIPNEVEFASILSGTANPETILNDAVTSFQVVLTGTFTPPVGWSTYKLLAQSSVFFLDQPGYDLVAELGIGGVAVGTIGPISGWSISVAVPFGVAGSRSGLSGPVTVRTRARKTATGAGNVSAICTAISLIAIRET